MFIVQAGIKTSADLFYFSFPVLYHVLFDPLSDAEIDKETVTQQWQTLPNDSRNQLNLQRMALTNAADLIGRLKQNHIYLVTQNTDGGVGTFLFTARSAVDGARVIGAVAIKPGVGVQVKAKCAEQGRDYLAGCLMSSLNLLLNA